MSGLTEVHRIGLSGVISATFIDRDEFNPQLVRRGVLTRTLVGGWRFPSLGSFGGMVVLIVEETRMSEKKQRRSWTPVEKSEIVLAGLRRGRPVTEVGRA